MLSKVTIVSGRTSEGLAERLSEKINAELVKSEIRIFPDGESKITLSGRLSKDKTVVVQSTHPPVDTNLVHVLSLIAKAKETSSDVIAVIPYMGYARQDKEFLSGEIVTMQVLGKLFKGAGASKIITVDVHSVLGLKHFGMNTENVTAIPDLVQYCKGLSLVDPLVVSPDQGGRDRAQEFAREFGSECIALEKKRDKKTGQVRIETDNVDVVNRDLILVDDMISTGGSIVKATEFLRRQGCSKVYVVCTHALLIDNAEKKIRESGVEEVISTNTIPNKTSTVVDITNTIAKTITE